MLTTATFGRRLGGLHRLDFMRSKGCFYVARLIVAEFGGIEEHIERVVRGLNVRWQVDVVALGKDSPKLIGDHRRGDARED
ncbi:hypothetical protein [Actinophytocola sp. KF-1]